MTNEVKAKKANRTHVYFKILQMEKLAAKQRSCIEFPYFGARYPDACCIEGTLWDLDSGDNEGLTNGGSDPCPTCGTREYIKRMLDDEYSIGSICKHLEYLFSRYGSIPSLLTAGIAQIGGE